MGKKTSVHGQTTFIGGVHVLPSHAPKAVTGKINCLLLEALINYSTNSLCPGLSKRELAVRAGLLEHQVGPRIAELRRLGYVRTQGEGQARTYAWSGKAAA